MTGTELRENRGIISMQYFGRDKNECYLPYSEKWEWVQTRIDYETHELVTTMKSTWNSSYNKEIRVKL